MYGNTDFAIIYYLDNILIKKKISTDFTRIKYQISKMEHAHCRWYQIHYFDKTNLKWNKNKTTELWM